MGPGPSAAARPAPVTAWARRAVRGAAAAPPRSCPARPAAAGSGVAARRPEPACRGPGGGAAGSGARRPALPPLLCCSAPPLRSAALPGSALLPVSARRRLSPASGRPVPARTSRARVSMRPAARAPAPLPRPGALVPARPGPAPSRPAPWRRAAEGTRGRRAGRGSLLLPPPGRGCGPRSRGLDGGPWASGPGSGLKRVSPREGPRAGARSRGVGEGAGSGWAGDQLNPACVSLVLHGPTRGPPAWQVRGRRGGPRGAAQSRAAPLRRGEGKLSVSHLGSPLPSETPPAPSPGAPGPRTPELRQSQALVIRRG